MKLVLCALLSLSSLTAFANPPSVSSGAIVGGIDGDYANITFNSPAAEALAKFFYGKPLPTTQGSSLNLGGPNVACHYSTGMQRFLDCVFSLGQDGNMTGARSRALAPMGAPVPGVSSVTLTPAGKELSVRIGAPGSKVIYDVMSRATQKDAKTRASQNLSCTVSQCAFKVTTAGSASP